MCWVLKWTYCTCLHMISCLLESHCYDRIIKIKMSVSSKIRSLLPAYSTHCHSYYLELHIIVQCISKWDPTVLWDQKAPASREWLISMNNLVNSKNIKLFQSRKIKMQLINENGGKVFYLLCITRICFSRFHFINNFPRRHQKSRTSQSVSGF